MQRLTAALFLIFSLSLLADENSTVTINVKSTGAVGDGKTSDTAAIQKAIDQAHIAGGKVDFPPGTYLTGSLDLKSNVTLVLDKGATIHGSAIASDYPLVTARWEGNEKPCHRALISALDASNIAIIGDGIVEGEAAVAQLRNPRGPTLIEPISCKDVRIEDVTVKNTRMWTIHPTYCQDVTISHVSFETHDWNSDGIDPDSCQHVRIDGCTFVTGDDSIAIKSGKGREGVKMNLPCEDITITNCNFVKGYSSIAMGSELSGGIRDVRISHCTFQDGRAALYLKSRPGRGGYVQDVKADHLTVGPEALLEVQTDYTTNADANGVPGVDGLTSFFGIQISDSTLKSGDSVTIDASKEKPLDGLILKNIAGTAQRGLVLRNAKNVVIENVRLDGIKGPRITIDHAEGTGVDNGPDGPTSEK